MAMKINHVSICVKNLDEALVRYKTILEIEEVHDFGTVESEGVKAAGISIGDFLLEFIQPTRTGPFTRFLERRGEGLHHLSFTVDNVEQKQKYLLAKGFELADTNLRGDVNLNVRYILVRPRSANGVELEFNSRDLIQPK
jgi:methylmalonyl-CoA/ethylmalonyl-CoA epimerase